MLWASARRSTHSAAVANATRWPAWQARMRQADGEVGLAGAGRAEEHDVVAGGDEVEGAEVGDDVALEGALVVEVELLEGLAGREAGGADAELAAVGLRGRRPRVPGRRRGTPHGSSPRLRARSASRSTAAASDGAFNARHR